MPVADLTSDECDEIRAYVRDRVQLDWRTQGARLTGITPEAAQEAVRWPIPPRKVPWDWGRLAAQKYGPSLDLAIWHGSTLCGLAYGRAEIAQAEGDPEWLELGYIETRPYAHELGRKIMRIGLTVLEANAAAFGIPETRICNPFVDMRGRYAGYDYTRVVMRGTTTYLCKREATREQQTP